MTHRNQRILEVAREQLEDRATNPPVSLLETAGMIQTQLHLVLGELALSEREQDPEKIFQALLTISCTCMASAGEHVLHNLDWEDRP